MKSLLSPIELIELAATVLGDKVEEMTFLGGSVVSLLITDPGARPPRATEDVDVTIELTTILEFYRFEKSLLKLGFKNAGSGPICRFVLGELTMDIMPTDPEILGFSNRWYRPAIQTASRHILSNKIEINLISPPCFLATKLDAFDSQARENHGDMLASRDFEDVIVLVDGRPSIAADVAAASQDIKDFLQTRFAEFREESLRDGISAHLDSDPASQARAPIVFDRIKSIISGG